jgi:hypothetical protein
MCRATAERRLECTAPINPTARRLVANGPHQCYCGATHLSNAISVISEAAISALEFSILYLSVFSLLFAIFCSVIWFFYEIFCCKGLLLSIFYVIMTEFEHQRLSWCIILSRSVVVFGLQHYFQSVFEWLVTHDTLECLVQKRVLNRVPNSETFWTSRAVVRCVSPQLSRQIWQFKKCRRQYKLFPITVISLNSPFVSKP